MGEPHVMGVHKDVLYKDIWVATVVEISANIADGFRVHDVNIFSFPVQLPSRYKSLLLLLLRLWSRDSDSG